MKLVPGTLSVRTRRGANPGNDGIARKRALVGVIEHSDVVSYAPTELTVILPAVFPGLTTWAAVSRPYGTHVINAL